MNPANLASALTSFKAPKGLTNSHVQTILAKLISPATFNYRRELHPDSTGQTQVAYDFIDASTTIQTKNSSINDIPIVVMFHGLEGSSTSHYALAFAHVMQASGWHGVVVHFRGCGEVANTADVHYHAGDSTEIAHVLANLHQKYTTIYAIGISLGGNMLAKYLGETKTNALCQAAVVACSPFNLAKSNLAMAKPIAKWIYEPYMLNSLKTKALAKATHPALVQLRQQIRQCKTIKQFDEVVTAPQHGFASADDYYQKASAKPLLKHIAKPTLIINALDDPFLIDATPKANEISAHVQRLTSPHGGHVGFVSYTKHQLHINWLPQICLTFFRQQPSTSELH